MISFKNFLAESRLAPLYHGTTARHAQEILRTNTLRGYGAVSFSRSEKFARTHPDYQHGASLDSIIVFEVDQNKLRQNYKLKPFNFFSTKTRFPYAHTPEDEDIEGWNEYEERVLNRDIKNFERYITKIIVYVKPGKPVKDNLILNHPKLYYNGKFVNK